MDQFIQIPTRVKFIFLFLFVLVFSIIAGLAFLHTQNSISQLRSIEQDFEEAFSTVHEIDSRSISTSDTAGTDSLFSAFLGSLEGFRERIDPFGDSALRDRLDNLAEITGDWMAMSSDTTGMELGSLLIHQQELHRNIQRLVIEKSAFQKVLEEDIAKQERRLKNNLLIILVISLALILLIIVFMAVTTDRSLSKLVDFTSKLEQGGQPESIDLHSGDEYQEIAERLNNYMKKQTDKLRFLRTVGQGNETVTFSPEPDDIFGRELAVMARRLSELRKEEQERMKVENLRRWTSDGIAQFAEILRSERENVSELSFLIIQKIVRYLGIEMGTLYITSPEETGQERLDAVATYAYDRRKFTETSFLFGEGLPGTCAIEKERIYMDEIPESYSDISSGVGQTKPRFLLLHPLKIESEIFGVLELASLRRLETHELDLVDQLADSIATTLAAVKTNEKTAQLLKQSREQAELLLRQEEEMRINLSELEKAQEESRKKESEITGIINAMNQSSLVAEFDLKGRFININKRFLELLQSPEEQVLGKNYSEFAVVEKYSGEYQDFWSSLRSGEIRTSVHRFRLYSGKEIWLSQTFTPILQEEGKVYKILDIAIDITQSKQLQESLEQQAAEITRKNLEMQSLNEAVNSSIIKCELDPDGIILDMNSNFQNTTGYTRKEMMGRNYRLFLKDIEKEQFERIWSEVNKDKPYEGAIRRTRPTGEEVWLMGSFTPVRDESGIIYKIYFLALDITEKKLKYQLLEEANKEIERLKEVISRYEA